MLALLLAVTIHVPAVHAHVGYAAMDLETGRTLSRYAQERFPMGSVYKVPIALELLHRVDRGELSLQQSITIQPGEFAPGWSPIRDNAHGQPVTLTIGKLFDALVSDSDNTASDVTQRLLGGAAAVTRRLRVLGVRGIRVDRTETQIAADVRAHGVDAYNADPRDTATPAAMLDLLRRLDRGEDGLSRASHELLMRTMETSRNPRRISVRLPPGTVVAHKTGTMPGVMNDAALVTSSDGKHHLAIVIFVNRARPNSDAMAPVIEDVAKQLYEALVPPARSGRRRSSPTDPWYRDRDERVADRFVAEVRRTLDLIEQFPQIGSRVPGVADLRFAACRSMAFRTASSLSNSQTAWRLRRAHTIVEGRRISWSGCPSSEAPLARRRSRGSCSIRLN
jgi:beta-lactamase class A